MKIRFRTMVRKITPVLSAGLLLQAGGCNFNGSNTLQQLTTLIANNLIVDFVFGAFSLPAFGGF